MNLLHKKTKPVSQEGKILKLLRDNEAWGVHNHQLAKIALCYTKRISNLRKEGFNIQAIRISKSDFKYYIVEDK